jgi:hypothetical protein
MSISVEIHAGPVCCSRIVLRRDPWSVPREHDLWQYKLEQARPTGRAYRERRERGKEALDVNTKWRLLRIALTCRPSDTTHKPILSRILDGYTI